MAKLKYWLPAAAWMAGIFFLSARTGGEIKNLFPFLPNLDWGHLGEYFVLGLLIYYGLVKTTRLQRPFALTVVLCTVYGATDEFHQYFVPGRSADIFDLINDAIGAAMAMAGLNLYQTRKERSFQTDQSKPRFAVMLAAALVVLMVLFNIWKPTA